MATTLAFEATINQHLAYVKPMEGELDVGYALNQLTVTRQLYYSEAHSKSLDVVLFLNGLPVVTAELKNAMSGQTVLDAQAQYRKDRDARELLFEFKKRALVHFAVDTDQAFMTTRLSGDKTHFLPFNLGNGGHAGNSCIPTCAFC